MKKRMLKQNEWMLRVALDSTYKSFLKAGCQICHIGQGVKSFVWSPHVRTWVLLLWHIYEETWGGRKGCQHSTICHFWIESDNIFCKVHELFFLMNFLANNTIRTKNYLFFWQNSTSWHEYMQNLWPLTAKTFEELRQIRCLIPMDS